MLRPTTPDCVPRPAVLVEATIGPSGGRLVHSSLDLDSSTAVDMLSHQQRRAAPYCRLPSVLCVDITRHCRCVWCVVRWCVRQARTHAPSAPEARQLGYDGYEGAP
ncbi:unnamed protein product [Ectocarpus sp. 12 AP-2014]